MDMTTIINQMLVLVIIMALGFLLGKLKLVDEKGGKMISKLVLDVATPANILFALLGGELSITGHDALIFGVVTLGCFALYYVLAVILPHLMRAPKKDVGVYQYMVMFSNSGFMGYPVAYAFFGEASVIYVTYFVIIFNIINFSLGISMIKRGHGGFQIKNLINPVIVTTVVALILLALKIRLPQFVLGTAETLSQFMTPMAMLMIGVTLSAAPLKGVFKEWRIFPTAFVKIVLIPLLVWLALRHIVTDPVMLGIAVVISGMPVASSATMMCLQYGANEKLASTTTFLTTVLTAVTVPLIALLLL